MEITTEAASPLDIPVMPLAKRVQYLERMRSTATSKAGELRREAEHLEHDASMAAMLLAEVRAGACGTCDGYGKVRMQYGEDDIKIKTCARCGGGGAA